MVEDAIAQALGKKGHFKFSPATLKKIIDDLIRTNDVDIVKTFAVGIIEQDPYVFKTFLHKHLTSFLKDDIYSKLFWIYGDYWLMGETTQHLLQQLTFINRMLQWLNEHGELSSNCVRSQLCFSQNGDRSLLSILPEPVPRLIIISGTVIEDFPARLGIIDKSGTIEAYRDSSYNLFLENGPRRKPINITPIKDDVDQEKL